LLAVVWIAPGGVLIVRQALEDAFAMPASRTADAIRRCVYGDHARL